MKEKRYTQEYLDFKLRMQKAQSKERVLDGLMMFSIVVVPILIYAVYGIFSGGLS